MEKELFNYYEKDTKAVYNAFLNVIKDKPFKKMPKQLPYFKLTVDIGFSWKFNMTDGLLMLLFAPKDSGTVVMASYYASQMLGARFDGYNKLLTECVEKELGIKAQMHEPLDTGYFTSHGFEAGSSPSASSFCVNCGAALKGNEKFCPGCGKKIDGYNLTK